MVSTLTNPPQLDLEAESKLQNFLLEQIRANRCSAHDCAEGGLVALAEAAIGGKLGFRTQPRPDALLFAESQSRVLVTVAEANKDAFVAAAAAAGVPVQVLGKTGGDRLQIRVNDALLLDVELAAAARAWQEAIPCLMEN